MHNRLHETGEQLAFYTADVIDLAVICDYSKCLYWLNSDSHVTLMVL